MHGTLGKVELFGNMVPRMQFQRVEVAGGGIKKLDDFYTFILVCSLHIELDDAFHIVVYEIQHLLEC